MKRVALSFICLSTLNSVQATTGTNDYGYGVVSKSMAGTGVAQAQDGFTAALNPAGIAFLSQDMLDLGFTVFSPRRKYSANALPPAQMTLAVAPGTHNSDSNWFFVPNFAFAKRINDKFSTGISFYANGGMNTNYGDDFGGSGMPPAGSSGAFGGDELEET